MNVTITNCITALDPFWQKIAAPLNTKEAFEAIKDSCLWSVVGSLVVSGGNPVLACVAGVISVASSCFSICALTEIKKAAATHTWIKDYRIVLITLPSVVVASTACLAGCTLFLPEILMIVELWKVAIVHANQCALDDICKPRSVYLFIF